MSLDKIQWKHINMQGYFYRFREHNGMTVGVHKLDSNTCEVFLSLCNKKDSFCKKTGRIQAAANPSVILPLKQVPSYLANYSCRLYRHQQTDINYPNEVSAWKTWCFRFVGDK